MRRLVPFFLLSFLLVPSAAQETGSGLPETAQARLFQKQPEIARGWTTGDYFGGTLASGDVTGDSIPDFIIGAQGGTDGNGLVPGSVHVLDGYYGSPLAKIDYADPYAHFGAALACADFNGDGRDDIAVGAPYAAVRFPDHARPGLFRHPQAVPRSERLPPNPRRGSVFIYSGGTGALIRRIDGWSWPMQFGNGLASADFNKDGCADLVVSAPLYYGEGANGALFILSGKDGRMLRQILGRKCRLTEKLAVGDVNGDGRPDVVVSAAFRVGRDHVGGIQVYSGKDGTLLHEFAGTVKGGISEPDFGRAVACVDVNGDGCADVITSSPIASRKKGPLQAGAVFVYSGRDGKRLHEWWGDERVGMLGTSVAAADFDRDGFPEILAGALGADKNLGSVLVFSTRTGRQVFRIDHASDAPLQPSLGLQVLAMDVRRDGVMDLLVSALGSNVCFSEVHLYFGQRPPGEE